LIGAGLAWTVRRFPPKGGEETGPNPTDRGRAGSKRHLITDAKGIPLAFLTAANIHDGRLFDELIDAVPPIRQGRGRPCRRPATLHADKGYDFPQCRRALRRRSIQPRIARRGVDSSERLGRHRWVIERTLAWFARYRRLTVRYERRANIWQAFRHLLDLATADTVAAVLPHRRDDHLAGELPPIAADIHRLSRMSPPCCSPQSVFTTVPE
jgi:transposase